LPSLDLFGSSSSFLELSISFSVRVRSPALRTFRTLVFRPSPGRPSSASLGVSSLFATSIETSNDVGSHASHHGLSRVTPVGTCPFGLSAPGVSHAFDGFLRSRSRELVSSRCHVQVFAFRGLSLASDRFRISPALSPLVVGSSSLRFDPRRLDLPSTSGVFSPLRVR